MVHAIIVMEIIITIYVELSDGSICWRFCMIMLDTRTRLPLPPNNCQYKERLIILHYSNLPSVLTIHSPVPQYRCWYCYRHCIEKERELKTSSIDRWLQTYIHTCAHAHTYTDARTQIHIHACTYTYHLLLYLGCSH